MAIIFLDLETTGLNPASDLILEVAAVAVDRQLNPLAGFASVIHRPRSDTYPRADAFVQKMHTDNGLWAECDAAEYPGRGLVAVTDALCAWLDALGTPSQQYAAQSKGEKHTLAGDSVHFDLAFLRSSMPLVAQRFSHRLLDVSAFRVAREILGHPAQDFGATAHRAGPDCLASIAKARWHLSRMVA